MDRIFNFSPGPSALPLPVLEKAQKELLNYQGSGMSVMEMSHRSKTFIAIYDEAVSLLRNLMDIPDEYEVLFLQGGATQQFSAVPLNLMSPDGQAGYVDSGSFAASAAKEALKYGKIDILASSKKDNYTYVPDFSINNQTVYDYIHITTNNTIYGTRYTSIPDCKNIPLAADASSNILSEKININQFGVLYAGAQKNIGPSGLCVVIVKKNLLGKVSPSCPVLLDWQIQSQAQSMYNTPNTFGIYMAKLSFQWLKDLGGVEAIEKINIEKANLLYAFIDESRLFKGTAQKKFRSRMNVTFITGDPQKDDDFIKTAAQNGLFNLKGHRSVGGMRASIYNAMPIEGVKALVDFMKEYEVKNS